MPTTGFTDAVCELWRNRTRFVLLFAGLMLNIAGEIQPVRIMRVKQRSPKSTRMATPSLRKA